VHIWYSAWLTAPGPQVDYYNSEGPFVGQYEVGQVVEAYKNEADSWSIKYFTEPDAGGLFFVRFEYERDQGGSWQCTTMGLHEPSGERACPCKRHTGYIYDIYEVSYRERCVCIDTSPCKRHTGCK
jgi:hypothetical protein